jgi:hypothetical protein
MYSATQPNDPNYDACNNSPATWSSRLVSVSSRCSSAELVADTAAVALLDSARRWFSCSDALREMDAKAWN